MNNKKEEKFIHLINQNQLRIRKLCAMYAQDMEDRKDLEQEVIINIWKSLSEFRGDAQINTWVYRIILNVCLKHTYTIAKNRNTISLENLNYEPSVNASHESDNHIELQSCIQTLEFSDKTIIILFLEELPYKSISEIMGISENHVAVKIKRIKSKLLKCLTKKDRV